MTGPAAIASEWENWGVDLAVEEINAAGGVLGRKLEVMLLDNKCNPSEGVNVANKLVEAKVVAIVGSHCSSAHLAAMPIIKDAKIPMITGVASNPQITDAVRCGRQRMGVSHQSVRQRHDGRARRLSRREEGRSRPWRSSARTPTSAAAERTRSSRSPTRLGSPSSPPTSIPQNAPDYTSILTRLQQRRPDAIATFQLAGDSLNFLRNAMQLGVHIPYTGRVELGGRNLQIIEAGGMEGSISAWTYNHEIDSPENKAFVEKIQRAAQFRRRCCRPGPATTACASSRRRSRMRAAPTRRRCATP